MCMASRGRPPVAKAAERSEVERLIDTGVAYRRAAEVGFGDARLRGRVERIVNRRARVRARLALKGPIALDALMELMFGCPVAAGPSRGSSSAPPDPQAEWPARRGSSRTSSPRAPGPRDLASD